MSQKYHGPGPQPTIRPPKKPVPAQGLITALCDARTAAITPRAATRGLAQADMRKQLVASGLTPRTDPGAGLSRGRASMARIIAQSGR